MIKKIFMGLFALVAMVGLAACQVDVSRGLTALKIGTKIYSVFEEAKASEPDHFLKRVPFYADLYCEFRDEYALKWVEIRHAAHDKGVPFWALSAIEKAIDKRCGQRA